MSNITRTANPRRFGIDMRSLPGSGLDRKHGTTGMPSGIMTTFRRKHGSHDYLPPP